MIAFATLAAALAACSWDRPGANPFTGDVVAAVDRYQDIPEAARAALKARMAARRYDEIATITRDGIEGLHRYTDLRDMHFGGGTVCRSVSRERWPAAAVERGLVYCEADHCLIVPTVCRNVSRISRAAGSSVSPPDMPLREVVEVPGGTGGLGWAQRLDIGRDEPGLLSIDWTPDPPPGDVPGLPQAVEAIPEPSTWSLMAAGLLLLIWAAWRGWR